VIGNRAATNVERSTLDARRSTLDARRSTLEGWPIHAARQMQGRFVRPCLGGKSFA
jgi:hypothetical protein